MNSTSSLGWSVYYYLFALLTLNIKNISMGLVSLNINVQIYKPICQLNFSNRLGTGNQNSKLYTFFREPPKRIRRVRIGALSTFSSLASTFRAAVIAHCFCGKSLIKLTCHRYILSAFVLSAVSK